MYHIYLHFLARDREPRAIRAPQRYGYEECVAYTIVGFGDESSSYCEAMGDSEA